MRNFRLQSNQPNNNNAKQSSIKKMLLLFLLFLLVPNILFADGKIKGVVTDSQNGTPLVGANVYFVGTSIGSSTDINGAYLVTAVPPGSYTIRCSYIGYARKESDIRLTDKQVIELDFALEFDVLEGEEVSITAQAEGQVAAINQQIRSDKIINVVSEQKIQELPDANAAESLGRLPGVSVTRSGGEANKIVLRGLDPKMTTVTVDGVKLSPTEANSRGIDLSTIPQGTLAGIELFKAITADMEAESIAGSVNLVTRTAPEQRLLRFDSFGSYGSVDKTYAQYNFVGKYSERFFNKKLGLQLFGNIEKKNRSSERYDVSIDQSEITDWKIDKFEVKYTPEIRERFGGSFILDYSTNDGRVLKLNTGYNRTERAFSDLLRDYSFNDPRINYNIRSRDINIDIFNLSLQGVNYLYDWQLNWNFSFTESNSEKPFDYDLQFVEPSTFDDEGNVDSGMLANEKHQKGPYKELFPYALNNFKKAYTDRAFARTSDNNDNEKTLFFDAKKQYNIFGMFGEIKFGGKYRSKYHRKNSTYLEARYYGGQGLEDYILLEDGSIAEKDFAGHGFGNLERSSNGLILLTNFLTGDSRDIYDKYPLYPIIDRDRARAWHDLNIHGINPNTKVLEYEVSNEEKGQQYNLTERTSAGYLMNILNYGSLATLITGVRLEYDDNSYNALFTPGDIDKFSSFQDTSATHSERMVLPNLHLIIRPADFMNVRLAAYRGIARPDFNFRLPTYVTGTASGGSISEPYVILGNPGLKNATAWNYELNFQFFGNDIGLLSLSAFYKEIKDEVKYIEKLKVIGPDIPDSLDISFYNDKLPFKSFQLNYPYNSEKPSKVWGFELEHQTNFRFLPGLLKNLVLGYNVSIVKTETFTPIEIVVKDSTYNAMFGFWTYSSYYIPGEEKTSLKNSPELFGNIALGYDYKDFSIRLSYFYQDKYWLSFSPDRRGDRQQVSYGRLDLSVKQIIADNLTIGFNVNNLNNIEEAIYMKNQVQGWLLERSRYSYGTSAELWLRVGL